MIYNTPIKAENLWRRGKQLTSLTTLDMPPHSVKGEVNCFPRADYFSAFRVIYHLKGLSESFRNRFHLSACNAMWKRITEIYYYSKFLMLCINNFSWQAPQTRGRFFSDSFSYHWPKKRIKVKRIASVDIDQSAMCYISIYLSRQALQNNGKFFFQISKSFSNY